MARLDEYFFKSNGGAIPTVETSDNSANEAEVAISEVAIIEGKNESIEKGNFQFSKKIREEKENLIDALSQFPVTALWLISKYGQNQSKIKPIDQLKQSSEIEENLEAIKKYFLMASLCFGLKESASDSTASEKQQLKNVLGKFPYSFEDLVELVDVVVFGYKYRGLSYQQLDSKGVNDADLVIKRLEGVGRRTKLNAGKFYELIRHSTEYQYDEQFLFLSISEMYSYFQDVVVSENSWLKSRQQLAAANSRLVLFIANQYKGSFLSFDDLVQEGQIGLLKAVDRFDHRMGFQFSTYAGYWIRQSISRALSRSERAVRVPCGQVANINKVFRAKEELLSKTGVEVTAKELAEYTKFSEDEINTILSISQLPLPLEGFDDDEESSFAPIDFLEQQLFPHPFKIIAESELQSLIANALKMLSSREEKIICSHFGIDCDKEMTLQDIGSELNLTRERVRQIQVKALNLLRIHFGQQLMSFL
jgi:RNA polymerase primary sigma factor